MWNDLCFSARMLRKNLGLTLVAVLTLALGIGANSAIFSAVNAVLLKPLAYPGSDRLILLTEGDRNSGRAYSVALPNFIDWRERSRSFEQMASYRATNMILTGLDKATRIQSRLVNASLLPMLGVRPVLGRLFTDSDDKPGAARVVILSEGFWRRQFGGDPAITNASLTLNDQKYAVAGVVPSDTQWLFGYELFVPIGLNWDNTAWRDRGNHPGIRVLARRKPDVSFEQARAEMETIARQLEQEYPVTNSGVTVTLRPLLDAMVEDVRPTAMVLFGAVGFVLLIACVNVSTLLLGRASGRRKEIAVRRALGAGAWRVARQLLTESVLLGLAGGAGGLLAAWWSLDLMIRGAPEDTPRLHAIALDWQALLFSLAVSVAAGILFGLAPVVETARLDFHEALKTGGRMIGARPGGSRLRAALLLGEVALAVMLVIGAGLSIRSLWNLQQVDPGFDSANVYTLRVDAPSKYSTDEKRTGFVDEALDRMRRIPGVRYAATGLSIPFDAGNWGSIFIVGDQPAPPRADLPSAEFNVVSPDYFRALGVKLLAGRTFTSEDRPGTRSVVVVNESFARRFWPDGSAVGKRLKQGWPEWKTPWREIIGVVADVRQYGIDREARMEVFISQWQAPENRSFTFLLKTSGPADLGGAVRAELRAMDADLAPYRFQTLEQATAESLGSKRVAMWLLAIFASLAVGLASLGIYGVMAYWVSQRSSEIGIRVALGARPWAVIGMVLRQGMGFTAAGLAAGLLGARALANFLSAILYGVTAKDAPTFILAALVLSAVAFASCLAPAIRALRVDPAVALRE